MIAHVDFSMFVDREGVIRRVERKKLRVLSRTGAYGRTVVKSKLKKRPIKSRWTKAGKKTRQAKLHSSPGEAPFRQTGLLHDRVFFGVDNDTDSVVVGPQYVKTKGAGDLLGKASVPQLLEEGGAERLQMPGGKFVTAQYEPRPFIEPSRPAVEDKFAEFIESIQL